MGWVREQSVKTMQTHGCPASSKLREKRKLEAILRGNFFWKRRENFMDNGVCFVPFLLWREFVPAYSSKTLLFCSKSLEQQTLKGVKRSNSVLVAIDLWLAFSTTKTKLRQCHLLEWSQTLSTKIKRDVIGLHWENWGWRIYICVYLIGFQTGTMNFSWRYVHLYLSSSQYIQMENFLEIQLRMRATLGFQEISVQMNRGLWHRHVFHLGSLFWSDTCGYIYLLRYTWDDCVSKAVNIIGMTCMWFPLGFKSVLSSLLNDSL